MALIGANNEEKIWNYLKAKGLNNYGIAGCMGNLFAESGLNPRNLQNTFEKKLGYTDETYVAAVDSGEYAGFTRDGAGFGLAQWTYHTRKQGLLQFAKARNRSIGDLEVQLDYLWKEMVEDFGSVLKKLKAAKSVQVASDEMLLKYEKPADTGSATRKKRAEYGQKYYNKYAAKDAATNRKPVGEMLISVGSVVEFVGSAHYASSNSVVSVPCKPGKAKVTAISKGAKHPYHLRRVDGSKSTVYGWVNAVDITDATSDSKQPKSSASFPRFQKRDKAPAANDKFWIHKSAGGLNECIEIRGGSCLPNCVGYAWGRFYEITGKRPNLSRANAENWYGHVADGYKRSQNPVVGAVACWRKGQAGVSSDGAGHVAIVEEVKSNGDILLSNSAYGGKRFYMLAVTKANGYRLSDSYHFQGFILPPCYGPLSKKQAVNTNATVKDTATTVKGKAKYSDKNKPLVCMMTQSSCYRGTEKMKPVGVLWHSTAANNPKISRYVQPDDDAPNRDELLALLGKNKYGNDWNHIAHKVGVNAWIGKLADGTVTTVQTLPWDFRPWGCHEGNNGSCNDGWVQFEICEASLSDPVYFEKVYKEACELTAYLCTLYDIDPLGHTERNGVKVPNILCHADSYALGFGSNHGDVNHWFPIHGKSMETARTDVAKLMGVIPSGVQAVETVKFKPYNIRVKAPTLNIRKGPGSGYAIVGKIKSGAVRQITAESDGKGAKKWGKLPSNTGWIALDYTDRV